MRRHTAILLGLSSCLALASGPMARAQTQNTPTQAYSGAPTLSDSERNAPGLPTIGTSLPRSSAGSTANPPAQSDAQAAGLRPVLPGDAPSPSSSSSGATPGRAVPWADSLSQYKSSSPARTTPRPTTTTRTVTGNPYALSAPMADRRTGKVRSARPAPGAGSGVSSNASASTAARPTSPGMAPSLSSTTPSASTASRTPGGGANPVGPTQGQIRQQPVLRPVDVPIVYEQNNPRGAQTGVPNLYAPGTRIDPQTGQIVRLSRTPPPAEDDPFAPTGLPAGAFTLRPSLEVMEGYDSNPARAAAGSTGSLFTQINAAAQAKSNWQRHEMTVNLRGTYNAYTGNSAYSRPDAAASVGGRIDISRDTRLELEGRYGLAAQMPGSANLTASNAARLIGLPLIHQVGASAGVVHDLQRIRVSLRGTLDHFGNENSRYSDGTITGNADLNYTALGTKARATYMLSPSLMPFVEIGQDRRMFDLAVDRSGSKRGSQAYNARAGAQLEVTRSITGEVSAGYETRSYVDPTLAQFGGLLFDASLIWTPTSLSTVTFTAKTATDETTLAGAAGILRHDVSLRIDHAFRRYLIGTGQIGYGRDIFPGLTRQDNRFFAGLGLAYKVNRALQFRADWRYDQLASSDPTAPYNAHTVMLGLKVMR